MHSQLQGLPSVVYAMLPELERWDLPEETLADCARCAMRPRADEPERPWHFNERTQCCTHHPYLANYLVGRALRRDDIGSERIRTRLENPEGRTALGLEPPDSYKNLYAATRATGFGHDEALICPFSTQGSLSCSIWRDRNSTCRTWFCKSSTGLPQKLTWTAIRDVLSRVEVDLARYCAATVPPPAEDASSEAWQTWFLHCAVLIDELAPEHAVELRSERLLHLLETVEERRDAAAARVLPDIVVPSVGSVFPDGAKMRLTGYSPYDGTTLSPHIFSFLSSLDGVVTWQEAALHCQQATGFRVDRALATHLFALRIIRAPQPNDDPYSPDAASPFALVSNW